MMRITRKIRALHATLALALMLASGTVLAAPPESGSTWTGMVSTEAGKTLHVVVNITTAAASMRFGEPAGCTIAAGPLHANGEARVYRFRVSQNGGPFCAKLYQGELSMNATTAESLVMTFQRGHTAWTGKLQRVVNR